MRTAKPSASRPRMVPRLREDASVHGAPRPTRQRAALDARHDNVLPDGIAVGAETQMAP